MTEKQLILHMLTSADKLSPFDVNMAIDAGWQHCIPYASVRESEVQTLVQDAVFSRGPSGVKRTGLFIGGRDMGIALSMLSKARQAMVPPFEIPVMADPSGAFTTAAGIIAMAEKYLRARQLNMENQRALIFGGTGPVGMTAAILAAQAGARQVALVSRKKERAEQAAEQCKKTAVEWLDSQQSAVVVGIGADEVAEHLAAANVVVAAAAAGVQVIDEMQLGEARQLLVAIDVNAVPPAGIAGVGAMDDGAVLGKSPSSALGVGALAVGNVKYQAQHRLLKSMYAEGKALDFHFEHACEQARASIRSS